MDSNPFEWAWWSYMLDNAEARAVIVSIALAGIVSFGGFLWGLRSSSKDAEKARQQQRREHTIDIVVRMLTTEKFARAFQQVNGWIGNPKHYGSEHANIILSNQSGDQAKEQAFDLLFLLGYYEFICQSFMSDRPTLDRDVIKNQRKTAIRDGFAVLASAIQARRETMHRLQQYEFFEMVALYFMALDFEGERYRNRLETLNIDESLTNEDPPIVHSFKVYATRMRNGLIQDKIWDDIIKVARHEDIRLDTGGRFFWLGIRKQSSHLRKVKRLRRVLEGK